MRIINLCAVYREAVNITPRLLNLVQLYEVYEVFRDDSVPRCRSSRGDLQKKRLQVNTNLVLNSIVELSAQMAGVMQAAFR